MSISRTVYSSTVCKLIKLILPDEVPVVSRQNAPTPVGQFSVVDLISLSSPMMHEITYMELPDPATEVQETIQAFYEMHFSVGFFGEQAMARASEFRVSVSSQSIDQFSNDNGISIGRMGDLRHLSTPGRQQFEERAQFELVIYVVDSALFLLNTINDLTINGSFRGAFNSDITIT